MQKLLLSLLFFSLTVSLCKTQDCGSQRITATENIVDGPISQLTWVGSEANGGHEVVFVSTSNKTIYRSIDGGKTLKKQEQLESIHSIYTTALEKKLLFQGAKGNIWTTNNLGDSYKSIQLGFNPSRFYPHPTNADWILALSYTAKCANNSAEGNCQSDLWITQDFGQHWNKIKEYVRQVSWGNAGNSGVPEKNIFLTTWKNPHGDQRSLDEFNMVFQRSIDLFATTSYTLDHFIAFLYYHDTVFLAKRDSENPNGGLELHVSVDDGLTFNRAIFPSGADLRESRYSIVDASEGSAFINVDHSTDGSWGHTYGSNSFDTDFSLSVKYNRRFYLGRVDFKRIQGIDGIYIANQYMVDETGSPQPQIIQTIISFDKGGEWQPINPPTKDVQGNPIDCPECSLNLFCNYEAGYSEFYSTENAVGLVLASGTVGKRLEHETNEVNVFFSRDAGITWDEVVNGPHLYKFGDQGAITIAAKSSESTNSILYSWNEGLTWDSCTFGSSPMDIRDIAIEPSATARSFLIYGTKGSQNQGIVTHIDFNNFHERECSDDDYEIWSPTDIRGQCLLGQKYEYTRRKRDAACFNPKNVEKPKYISQCDCQQEDYECDFCFEWDEENSKCVFDDTECSDFNPYTAPTNCNQTWQQTRGYRKVAGDMCKETDESKEKWDPITRTCEETTGEPYKPKSNGSNGPYVALIVAIVLVSILLVVGVCFAVALIIASRNQRVRVMLSGYLPKGILPSPEANYSELGQLEPDSLLGTLDDDDDVIDQFDEETDIRGEAPDGGLSDSSDTDFDPRV